jgi:hypothetical protein
MTPIQIAARKRDEAIDAAKRTYWHEREKLAAECQARIDAAQRQYITDEHRALCHILERRAA